MSMRKCFVRFCWVCDLDRSVVVFSVGIMVNGV